MDIEQDDNGMWNVMGPGGIITQFVTRMEAQEWMESYFPYFTVAGDAEVDDS